MRRNLMAVGAALLLGTATLTTGALAAPRGGVAAQQSGASVHGSVSAPSTGHSFSATTAGHTYSGRTYGGTNFTAAAPGRTYAYRGNRGFRGHRGRFTRGGIGLYAFGGPAYYYGYDCWRHRWVRTRFGWRWRLVDVCRYY